MNVIKLPEVLKITECSKSFWHDQIKNGTSPKPVKLGCRAVAWLLDDVNTWLEERIKQSKQDAAGATQKRKRSASNLAEALTFFNTYSILKRG